jgi:hypothetical protein
MESRQTEYDRMLARNCLRLADGLPEGSERRLALFNMAAHWHELADKAAAGATKGAESPPDPEE